MLQKEGQKAGERKLKIYFKGENSKKHVTKFNIIVTHYY